MKTKLIVAALILGAFALGQSTRKYNIKISHLDVNTISIVCLNGADPTGTKYGSLLLMSCGEIPKEKVK